MKRQERKHKAELFAVWKSRIGKAAAVIYLFAFSLILCACSSIRSVADANSTEIPVEAVMEEMAEIIGEKEQEAEDEMNWYMEALTDAWLTTDLMEEEREEIGDRGEDAYRIAEEQGEGEYIVLTSDEGIRYLQRPANRTDKSYLESEGAFRFEIPEGWIWGYCDLDARLDSFWEDEDVPCLIWAIEDNDMGENAFSEDWEGVCAAIRDTAETVFGENMTEFTADRYTLEDGGDVYNFRCVFYDERGYLWVMSAAYRFGEKYMLEFIGIKKGEGDANLENLALYTAATYEEYEGDRYREYEGEGSYKGMDIWEYKKFHNPFVIAYAQANGKDWVEE